MIQHNVSQDPHKLKLYRNIYVVQRFLQANLLVLFPTLMLAATGCGSAVVSINSGSNPIGATLRGKVYSGQHPISGASVILYQAGSSGPETGAVKLLKTPVLSGNDGSFTLSSDSDCSSSTAQVYLVAQGGNPGSTSTSNAASLLMAALGDCGNLSDSSVIQINEVTTVASAWALAQFLGSGADVGSSSTNATGLRNAFLIANSLANMTKGASGGPSLPTGAIVEANKLDTLANVLSACVSSDGGSACRPLFQTATVNGIAPTNTLDAALNIVRHPSSNVASVFNASSTQPPFIPQLAKPPNDWTMTITYTANGLNAPTGLAVDSTGSVWVANYFGATAVKLSPTGQPSSPQGFQDASLHESFGITVDAQDNVWITNEETTNGVNSGHGSITELSSSGAIVSGSGFSGGGIFWPQAIAADSNGSVWVADYGSSTASLLSASTNGSSLLGSSGIAPSGMEFPVGVAVDSANNAWFASQGGPIRITQAGVGTAFSCGCAYFPSAIAIDPSGNIWLTDYSTSNVYQFSANGVMLQTLSASYGIDSPQSIAIDGAGSAWVANYHGKSISGIGSANGGATSAHLLSVSGFGIDSALTAPFGLAVDASGNLWVSSHTGNTVLQFVGLASPIKTPLLGPPSQP